MLEHSPGRYAVKILRELLVMTGALFAASASAEPVIVSNGGKTLNEGVLQISGLENNGHNIGCVSFVDEKFTFSYNKTFSNPPQFLPTASAEDPNDSVQILSTELFANHAIVHMATRGRNSNQICANAYINFTVSDTD